MHVLPWHAVLILAVSVASGCGLIFGLLLHVNVCARAGVAAARLSLGPAPDLGLMQCT